MVLSVIQDFIIRYTQAVGGRSSQLPGAGPRALLTTPAGVPFLTPQYVAGPGGRLWAEGALTGGRVGRRGGERPPRQREFGRRA